MYSIPVSVFSQEDISTVRIVCQGYPIQERGDPGGCLYVVCQNTSPQEYIFRLLMIYLQCKLDNDLHMAYNKDIQWVHRL